MSKKVYEKTTTETYDYIIDWSDFLDEGDTISTSEWIIPDGITKVDELKASDFTDIWLTSGTVGTSYTIINLIVTVNGRTSERYIVVNIIAFSNIDYLILDLRLHLGDINEATYRYTDEWLSRSLIMAVKGLSRWWRYKYIVDNTTVSRNPYFPFALSEPPIIEVGDERAIILMSSLIIKGGDLENNAWNLGSWRDAEIAFSNIEASRSKNASIQRDYDELVSLITPPNKRLARTRKGSLPGYINDNQYEIGNFK